MLFVFFSLPPRLSKVPSPDLFPLLLPWREGNVQFFFQSGGLQKIPAGGARMLFCFRQPWGWVALSSLHPSHCRRADGRLLPTGVGCCQASDSPFFFPSSPASLSSDWLLLSTKNCPSGPGGLAGRLEAAIRRLCSSRSWKVESKAEHFHFLFFSPLIYLSNVL